MKYVRNLSRKVIARGVSVKDILQNETSIDIHPINRKYFRRANLRKRDLEGVKIIAASDSWSPRRSDFMGASFTCANLTDAEFCGLDLRGVDFTDSVLINAQFRSCNLDGARFDGIMGRGLSISECSIKRIKANDADFSDAILTPPGTGEEPHMPADGALFQNCNFVRTKFRGDWTNSTFIRCNLKYSEPGSYSSQGAVWGVAISLDSRVDGMLTANCSGNSWSLPAGHVETPDASWDEYGFEVDYNLGDW